MTTFGSLFSGIGGFDLGFERAGMECRWQVEIDDKARGVLDRHWPDVTKYKDVCNVGRNNLEAVDLICGGFPCQDLSIAGKRAGLAGERSGLWREFHRIIAELKPQWVVIENVPGLLSSNGGADFAVVLQGLVECGYGVAWRVLDSQYFGVAQRRRRVFIVGSLGDGRAAEVLFEREGGARDTPPGREKGEGVARDTAPSLAASGRGTERAGESRGQDPVIPVAFASDGYGQDAQVDISPSLLHGGSEPHHHDYAKKVAVAWHNKQQSGEVRIQGDTINAMTKQWGTGGNNVPFVGVRRLTPTESERLQGFPDGWTDGQSDSARYRQLGNAVTVNVLEWIGRRILEQQP